MLVDCPPGIVCRVRHPNREESMSVSAHFIQPIYPQAVIVSLAGYLAAAVMCADRRTAAR